MSLLFPKRRQLEDPSPLVWAQVDLAAIRHNLTNIRKLSRRNRFLIPTRHAKGKKRTIPNEILAVIKADAYGHGMIAVAKLLEKEKVSVLGVSDVAEGIRLRRAGIRSPILLLESTLPQDAAYIGKYELMPTICTMELAKALNQYAPKRNKTIPVHIKVDTGMSRLGVPYAEGVAFVQKVQQLRRLTIEGIFTHFPVADTDRKFTQSQIQKIYDLVLRLDRQGIVIPFVHAVNSMGLIGYKTDVFNLSRPGLLLYGLPPYPRPSAAKAFKPALSVYSQVIFLKEIFKGNGVSYGRHYIAKKKRRIAVIPIGYSDGYLRSLSNRSSVIIQGKRCPVLGNVTMDQIMVDVTHVRDVRLGSPVCLLGTSRGKTVSAQELALWAGTINYEIVCQLGNSLPRIYPCSS
jgi:alanine racemase